MSNLTYPTPIPVRLVYFVFTPQKGGCRVTRTTNDVATDGTYARMHTSYIFSLVWSGLFLVCLQGDIALYWWYLI